MWQSWYHPDHVHTMYPTLQLPETNTFYTQRILGVIIIIAMIKEKDNYKVMFYFLSPNVLLLFILKIAL